jgi:hypothetical protein
MEMLVISQKDVFPIERIILIPNEWNTTEENLSLIVTELQT